MMDNIEVGAPYKKTREEFEAKYTGGCFCGAVRFEVADDPVGVYS